MEYRRTEKKAEKGENTQTEKKGEAMDEEEHNKHRGERGIGMFRGKNMK